ncbi:MAG: alpha/beta fold hydrolase [archaeon]
MESKVFVFNEFNEKLVGLETIPLIEKQKYPTILLVHGFGVTKNEYGLFDELAEKLSFADFLVYRFDFSGSGESEGDYSKTTLSKQASELKSILDFVKLQLKVDSSKIGILAQSFGTAVTVALMPQVQALVFTGSIAHVSEVLGNPVKWVELNKKGSSKKIKHGGKVILIGPQFWVDLEKHDLLTCVKKINCPVLFIHGSKDERVPLTEMQTYFDNANDPKEKIIIESAFHDLKPCREKAYKLIVKWFNNQLSS